MYVYIYILLFVLHCISCLVLQKTSRYSGLIMITYLAKSTAATTVRGNSTVDNFHIALTIETVPVSTVNNCHDVAIINTTGVFTVLRELGSDISVVTSLVFIFMIPVWVIIPIFFQTFLFKFLKRSYFELCNVLYEFKLTAYVL